MYKQFLITLYFFLTSYAAISQSYSMAGVAKSLNNKVLYGANILAFPQQSSETKFAISNQNGEYQLKLEKGITYSIEVSYLGYEKLVFEYTAIKDETRDLVLTPKTNELDEVVLEYKIPIEIKEDTITYNTDAFVNGQERKLREVLKKLPGIEVDREGNVTAQGKKVTKVLVEDKTFFTGNSKLAVNNKTKYRYWIIIMR